MERRIDTILQAVMESGDEEALGMVKLVMNEIDKDPKYFWDVIYILLEQSNNDQVVKQYRDVAKVSVGILTMLMFERFGLDLDIFDNGEAERILQQHDEEFMYEYYKELLKD